MKKIKTDLRYYYRQVQLALPCSWREKRYILSKLENGVDQYRLENPNADIQQIMAHFGMPCEIASSYADSMNTASILVGIKYRRRVFQIVICTVVAIMLSWVIYIGLSIRHQALNFPGYIEVGITYIEEPTEVN